MAEEEKEKKDPPKRSNPNVENQQWAVLLFALAILILLFALIQGTAGWFAIHKALKGFFGLTLLVIPVMLGYIAVMLDKDETPQKILHRALTGLVSVGFFGGLIEIMFGGGRLLGHNPSTALQLLYDEGLAWNGGGMFSAIVAMPLLNVFGDIGAKIIICLLLFVSLMWMSKKGLSEFFSMLGRPFRTLWRVLHEDYEDAAAIEEYDKQDEALEIMQEENDTEAISMVELAAQTPPQKEEVQFLFDVPVEGEVPQAEEQPAEESAEESTEESEENAEEASEAEETDAESSEETAEEQPAAVEEPADERSSDRASNDAAIEEMIRHAMENGGKKKTKEQEREEAVSEIAVEVAQQAEAEAEMQYRFPPINYLRKGESFAKDKAATLELREKADRLTEVLQSFNVSVRITNIARGPAVTRYEVQPAAGVKVSKITNLSDDIALSLAAQGVRIEAPIPGKAAIGIEVPNTKKDVVSLREILDSDQFRESKSKLAFAVGRDIAGNIIVGDIAKMPHMIIAGTTGSGKSVCTNSIIMSILYHASPSEVKLILIDPKIVEFRVYDGIPHLLIPVVTDPKKAAGALNWAVQEMLTRYSTFAETGVRDLSDYNRLCEQREDLTPMPQIVIAIDELADLMMASSKEVEDSICRLAQMARAAGMHLIISTQRPTTDVITGLIKANIPSRIALSVKDQINSRTILDAGGAEKLLGNGDMLYLPNGQPKAIRVQGCYVSTQEIERVVAFVKKEADSEYDEKIIQAVDQIAASNADSSAPSADEETQQDGDSELIERAIEVVVYAGQASTSNLQRRLKLGYARAARIMDELEEMGIIGPYEGAKPRRVLLSKMEYEERKLRKMNDNHTGNS